MTIRVGSAFSTFVCLCVLTVACSKPAGDASVDAAASATATSDAAAASTTTAASDASAATTKAPGHAAVDTLGISARHPKFYEAWNVNDKVVLIGCGLFRVLEGDPSKGRDVVAPLVSLPNGKPCASAVRGVIGDSLYVTDDKPTPTTHTVNIETGIAGVFKGPFPSPKGLPPDSVTGVDAKFAYASNGRLVATDKKTGKVDWDYGIGVDLLFANQKLPVLWTLKGEEILISPIKPLNGEQEIGVFRRGNPEPLWQGTVSGIISDASNSYLPIKVYAGAASGMTDKKGAYSFKVATRGLLEVSTEACGAGCGTDAVFKAPAANVQSYTVNIPIKTFDQACQ